MKKIILIKITQILLALLYAKCSRVIDEHDQKGINLEDFCPEIGTCIDGSHIACNYNPNQRIPTLCTDSQNLSMTKEYADLLLNAFNSIRGRIARGVSLNNVKLPRGYGIFRLQWDQELATFAQLWVDQCIIGLDSCRATKKFPDPAQFRAISRFHMDWTPRASVHEYPTGFSKEKVVYACRGILAFWYRQKDKLADIESIVKGHLWQDDFVESPFLQIIQGSATHIGCGINAFMQTVYRFGYINYNVVRIICNISKRLKRGDRIYTVDPPTNVGYTKKCGCPLGYDEDSRCLCYESGRGLPYSCKYEKCTPNVVILPIFTVENKPLPNSSNIGERRHFNELRKFQHNIDTSQSARQSRICGTNTSIFAKSPMCELKKRKIQNTNSLPIQTDATPRNYFSNIENLSPTYFQNREINRRDINDKTKYLNNHFDKRYENSRNNMHRSDEHIFDDIDELVDTARREYDEAPPLRKTAVQGDSSVISLQIPSRNTIKKSQISTKGESDKKIMDILIELEKDTKSLHIGNSEKSILDEKIKRIYEYFIDKSYKFDKNNVPNIHHNIQISDYGKTYLQSELDENQFNIPPNDNSYFNNKKKDVQDEAHDRQIKISTRKVIYLNNGNKQSNIDEENISDRRNYWKTKPKRK